jgi:hypothetical protein
MRFLTLSLALAAVVALAACAGKSSSNSSDQSNAAATSAAEATTAATAEAAASPGSGDIPAYPGATTQGSGTSSNMGQTASGTVMTTDDSFDKVYTWYQQHMPAGSEKSHMTTPVQSAVFVIGDPSTVRKSVTLTVAGSKTMISIASVKN